MRTAQAQKHYLISLPIILAVLLHPSVMFSAHPRHIASLHIRVKAHNASDVQLSVFLISLPQSSDRRERIRPQLLRHAASITEVQAIDGRKGDLQQFTIKVPPSCDATTKAQLAVTASHLKAIHEAYRSNADMALIVEDDMKVLRWPSHGLLYIAPPDWDILLLYMMGAQADSIYRSPSSLWVAWGPSIFSAGAYIIHRPAMQKILDTYMPGASQSEKFTTLDLTAVSTNWEHPLACQSERVVFSVVRTYVCTDFTIVEDSGESTLEKSHRPQHDATAELVQQLIEQHGYTLYS